MTTEQMIEEAAEAIGAVFHEAPAQRCRWAARLVVVDVLRAVAERLGEEAASGALALKGEARTPLGVPERSQRDGRQA